IFLIMGLPGTGKTTIARYVARRLQADILTTDLFRKALFEHSTIEEIMKVNDPLHYDLQEIFDRQPEYKVSERIQQLIEKQKDLVYDALFERLSELVRMGKNVVLDGTFFKRKLRERAYSIANETKSPIYVINCECPEDVITQRMNRRKKRPDSASYVDKMKIYNIVKQDFESPVEDGIPLITVNTYTSKITAYNINHQDSQANQLIEILKKRR
ncbi:MAG: AAA family ATPase, partial [Candidatus Hodarchaeota archaeon]